MLDRTRGRWTSPGTTGLSLALTLTLLTGCAAPAATAPALPPPRPAAVEPQPVEQRTPVTILISIDGFRPDYLGRGVTPRLNALAAAGVSAPMHPSFPSKTFPNHWTMVTGLRPDRNGIVANTMEDARRPGETFKMATTDPFWWSESVPVWVEAEQAGIRTATMFWPGSSVAVGGTKDAKWGNVAGGTRPSDWWPFDWAVPSAQRVAGTLDWMRRPAAVRPRFVTLYFDPVDTAGHDYGPDAPETTAAVAEIDRQIGALVDGLTALGQPANLVIVSDHGMAALSQDRTVALGTLARPADYRVIESGPYASLAAVPGHEQRLEARLLRPHPHVQCWRKAEIPARFHYGANPRVPPYFCLAETGWHIAATLPEKNPDLGNHGFDNMAPEMTALFIANGPAFAAAQTLPAFDNVAIAPLVRDLLGLPAVAGDGDDAPFRGVLKR